MTDSAAPKSIADVRRSWDGRPCEIRRSPKPVGSREYFDQVEARKYFVEPHIPRFAGILDLTHARLFTFASLRRLVPDAGVEIVDERGIPAPLPLALGAGLASRGTLAANELLIKLLRPLFAYQSFVVARPPPALEYLPSRVRRTRCRARHCSVVHVAY